MWFDGVNAKHVWGICSGYICQGYFNGGVIMGCEGECCCEGPGFCPRYGKNMTPRMWEKCQDPVWRLNFTKFFEADVPVEEEEKRIRMMRYERSQQLREEEDKIVGGLSSGGCGCSKRKSFLNKILPFMKNQDEKKEDGK
jgi:hypothetical protein